MTTRQITETTTELDLELIGEYSRLTEVESAIRKRKNEIKKEIREYLIENNLQQTEPYNNLIAVLEERTSYSLNPIIMEAALPPEIFSRIVKKEINLSRVKAEFLNENISLNLLQLAEMSKTSYAFAVREEDSTTGTNRKVPFWKEDEE